MSTGFHTSDNMDVTFQTSDFRMMDTNDMGQSLAGIMITSLASSGSSMWKSGSTWVAGTTNQVISAADIYNGNFRFNARRGFGNGDVPVQGHGRRRHRPGNHRQYHHHQRHGYVALRSPPVAPAVRHSIPCFVAPLPR